MLKRLTIINYAIIDRLELIPDAHLNIVTGETGAGKSIILGALSLILGDRADYAVMIDKEEKSVVEGIFDVHENEHFKKTLVDEGLDVEDECIIRREITAAGKSRAFVNDTPVNLATLNKLTSLLVDLHRQFDNLALEDDFFQLQAIDAIGILSAYYTDYHNIYERFTKVNKQYTELLSSQQKLQKEADFKLYLLEELVQADLKTDEIELTELQLKQISQAEKIITILQNGKILLGEGETPIVNELVKYQRQLQGITDLVPALQPVNERLLSASEELKDILSELENEEEKISMDPEAMEAMQQRIDLGYKLLKKHAVRTTAGLIAIRQQLEQELKTTLDQNDLLESLGKEADLLHKDLLAKGALLSIKRQDAATPFAEKVSSLLTLVGMPNARFKVQINPIEPAATGMDHVQFMLDANNSGQFRPLGKVASGGEMSRIMLCIKSLIAKALQMPVLIFDEVDTGISGEAAKQVAKLLHELSNHHQVICITHQPQVAARGTHHFYVYKQPDATGKLSTRVKVLQPEERILSIARMIGGEHPGEAAISHAKELIAG